MLVFLFIIFFWYIKCYSVVCETPFGWTRQTSLPPGLSRSLSLSHTHTHRVLLLDRDPNQASQIWLISTHHRKLSCRCVQD